VRALDARESNLRSLVMNATNRILIAACFTWMAAFCFSIVLRANPTQNAPNTEPQKTTNPVASTPESIAAGRKLYEEHCSECHGDEGKGDGMMGEDLDTPPADLTDREWKHGDTDGEIFVVIRDGTKDGMKKFGKKLSATDMWQLVNYLRSIAPR
jgi:mono/diheme cytochrome c family protein